MTDQNQRVKTLKRELEGWREVLVGLHSIAVWDKQYYPVITSSVISILFLVIWYIDPAVLTLLSFIGIVITLCDYLIPQVVPWLCGSNNWTGPQERQYEQIITSLASVFTVVSNVSSRLQSMKTSRPKTYFVTVTAFLMLCAWIGSSVDNLFLTYLIAMLGALYPGLRRQGIIKKYFGMIIQTIAKILLDMFPKPVKKESEKTKKKD